MDKLTLKRNDESWDDHGLFELGENVKLKNEITLSQRDHQPIVIGQPDSLSLYAGLVGKVLNRKIDIVNSEMRVYYQTEFYLGTAHIIITLHEGMLEEYLITENNSNAD